MVASLVWEKQPSAEATQEESWRVWLREDDDKDDDVQQEQQSTVVDVTWHLERQRRKVQHAQKVGQAVNQLDVCYQDEHVIVVNKPGSVLTVPGVRQHASLLDAVHAHCFSHDHLTNATHRIVHRLDMDTSGLVMFGRSLDVTKRLQAMWRERNVVKRYRAVVAGHWRAAAAAAGTIDLDLQRDLEHAPFMRVSTAAYDARARRHLEALHAVGKQKQWVYQAAKPSVTKFSVVRLGWFTSTLSSSREEEPLPYTVLDLEPITGRTHQLRVHCAALGHPIIGDPTYGWFGEAAPLGGLAHDTNVASLLQAWNAVHPPNVAPLCLHAASLELPHPMYHNDDKDDSSVVPKRISCHTTAPFDGLFDERACHSPDEGDKRRGCLE